MSGLVSIIIPVYNAEATVGKCIQSVLSQSYADIQVVVVNDGSTDNSSAICCSFSDARILVIDAEHRGISSARNTGLDNARGENIYFLDADDYLKNNAISDLMVYPQDLVISGFRSECVKLPSIPNHIREYLLRPNMNTELAFVWGKMFKRSIIEANHIRFKAYMDKHEDTEFVFNYLHYVNNIGITGNETYVHSCPVNGAGMRIFDSFIECETLLSTIKRFAPPQNLINHARISLKIVEMIRAHRLPFAKHYRFIEAIVGYPFVRKSLDDYLDLPGNSKLIPFLMRYKLCFLLTLVCRARGKKRYG